MTIVASIERIQGKIFEIRGLRVMLDRDLAELYGVEIRVLKQAVRRNIQRFPKEFLIELNADEYKALRSQNVILKRGQHSKYLSFAFTEPGVAMLSSVLNSELAIQVNIQIILAFIKLREMLASNADLARKLDAMEMKYDRQFRVVFDAIRQLMAPPETKKKEIGFLAKEKRAEYRLREKRK